MRLGLVGTGYWATTVHAPSAAQHPGMDFVGVWGRNHERAVELGHSFNIRAFADFDALLDQVDALTFALAPEPQAALAARAAERGTHILLEKPIATSIEAAQRLERAVEAGGAASIVFFTRRFVPETASWLSSMAQTGGWECGRAEFCSNIFVPGGPYEHSQWRRDKGALWDLGPHALSLLWPLLGAVTSVLAASGRGDQAHLILRHANGASSTLSLSLTVPELASGSQVYVYGEAGREAPPLDSLDAAGVIAAHQRALDALLEQARSPGLGHACDVHFGARVVEVLAAAEQSLLTGCAVPVPGANRRAE